MVLLEPKTFLQELDRLYKRARESGSVWVSMKRVTRKATKLQQQDTEPKCLVRATNGKKKISCAISENERIGFHMEIMTVVKASTDSLLKKKKNTKKIKAT